MRASLLAAIALLAAAAAAAAGDEAAAMLKAKRGIAASRQLLGVFSADIFEANDANFVSELLSETVSFAGAFANFFGDAAESPELRAMRRQFAESQAKLIAVQLPLGDAKELLDWRGSRRALAELEAGILEAGRLFQQLVGANSTEAAATLRRRFAKEFADKQQAAYQLHLAVVDEFALGQNLAKAAARATRRHRRKVTSFLLHACRLVLRGAQMQLAYERIVDSEAASANIEAAWRSRLRRLAAKLQLVDAEVKAAWSEQLLPDIRLIVEQQRGLGNKDFVAQLHSFLVDKFSWRHWFAVAYSDVGGWDKHAISHCGGGVFFRGAGGRNVAVASADPQRSKFWPPTAESVLRFVDGSVRRQNARDFLRVVNERLGAGCEVAALRAAICWGCNVWFAASQRRLVYRRLSTRFGGNMNVFIFG